MSYSSYDRVKEQIREAIDIVELVSRFVPLRRVGRHYVGRCPWHEDSRPSLQINPERQSYKCWVCNLGGDIFSFIMQMEKVDFKEAMEILADLAGITLPKKKEFFRPREKKQADPNQMLLETGSEMDGEEFSAPVEEKSEPINKRTLYQVMEWVHKQYHEALLQLEEAAPAREYLRERGIQEESVKSFGLGYSPLERDWLLRKIDNNPRRIECLEAVGVLARFQEEVEEGDGGEKSGYSRKPQRIYDRFRGRLLFPIRDTQDRTIAFGGRVLPGSTLQSRAKYVNSPETVLFTKSKQLYGLDIARIRMRSSRRALIMEGYTDCIMSHQVGLSDAVAVLGTALGTEHIKILKRFVDKMILVLDGDEAGQKRANEVLELFVAQGVDLSILTLPAGSDPCEFLLENGKEVFEHLIESEALDALEHAFRSATKGIDLEKDIVGSSQALDKLISVIASAPRSLAGGEDPRQLRIEKTLGQLAMKFHVPESDIRKRLKQWRERKSKTPYNRDGSEFSGENPGFQNSPDPLNHPEFAPDHLEKELLELWFADPSTFSVLDDLIPEEWFLSPLTRRIHQELSRMFEKGEECSFPRLLTGFEDPSLKNTLVEIDESAAEKGLGPEMDPEKREQLITEIIRGFTLRDVKRRSPKEITSLKGESLSKEEKKLKLKEIIEQQRVRHNTESP